MHFTSALTFILTLLSTQIFVQAKCNKGTPKPNRAWKTKEKKCEPSAAKQSQIVLRAGDHDSLVLVICGKLVYYGLLFCTKGDKYRFKVLNCKDGTWEVFDAIQT
ncbi:hypothetical protein FKW77_007942 [Venturia effusa]|uniref:Uncharacterized protein n=1 Tax=Venturia effusa TaxID=50376 RepID=A0A517KWW2_9PEZI|nr:hypothetical protein FKW77_007942 [Venturia effusa]